VTEGRALLLAGAAHLALLVGLSLSWAMTAKTLPDLSEAVPVDIVEISDVPRITEPPKPSMDAAPQETVEAAAPAEMPPEQAAPDPVPLSEAATAPPKPQPKPAAEAKKPAPQRLDSQQLANLIDKKLPKAERRPLDVSRLATTIEKSLPKGAQLSPVAAATLAASIRAQIYPCWNPPLGGEGTAGMTVLLRVNFAKTGAVTGVPQLIGQTGGGDAATARVFAESARRAVLRCSPLTLPAESYEAWKQVEINFDPRLMT
jgi:outer membrane biosynthesis protein TonB